MIANSIFNNFASGELSPHVWSRTERPFYNTGCEIMRNFVPLLTGGAFFRPGFEYIHHTRLNQVATLISFKFNAAQAYTLEFTAAKMRVFKNAGVVLEASKNITGITRAATGVVTSAGHGFSTGDEVYFSSVVGMTEVNGQFYIVVYIDATTFSLKDIDGNVIDTSAFTAYTSGGTVSRVYEITSPYAEADLPAVKVAQTADLMYMVHPSYAPRKLTRSGHAAWTLATYSRTADPFLGAAGNITGVTKATVGVVTLATHGFVDGQHILIEAVVGMTELNGNSYIVVYIDANTFSLKTLAGVAVNTSGFTSYTSGGTAKLEKYPAAVGFYGGRIFMGGSNEDPDVAYGSRGPNATTGASQYDDFTVGTAATDAVVYTLSSQNLTADRIRWFGATPSFLVVGTSGGLYKGNGGTDGSPITGTAVAFTPISAYAVADLGPMFVSNQLVYIEDGSRTLRSFEYDLINDNYYAFDKNILAGDITYPYIIQITYSKGRPELVWAVRSDGVLLTCTFLSREDVAGWARHYVGGSGKVLSVSAEPQPNAFDRAVICVERTIDGHTRRYIEYQSVDPMVMDFSDRFSVEDAFTADDLKHRNLTFEIQKQFIRLDSALTLDTTQTIALTLSALTGSITVTAASSLFAATDVGKYFSVKYITGAEAGVARITAFTSDVAVTARVEQNFLSTTVGANAWYLMASEVHGLGHLEGLTVGVITDGGVHSDVVVTAGSITLDYPARYVIIGLKYLGFLRSLDLEQGNGQGATSQGTLRNILGLTLKLKDTLGGKYGSTVKGLYELQEMAFRHTGADFTDRPPLLYSGPKALTHFDSWEEEKRIVIVQDNALPMTILTMTPVIDTAG